MGSFNSYSNGSPICNICIRSLREKRFSGHRCKEAEKNRNHLSGISDLLIPSLVNISKVFLQFAISKASDENFSRWFGNMKYRSVKPSDQISLFRTGFERNNCSIGRKRVSSEK